MQQSCRTLACRIADAAIAVVAVALFPRKGTSVGSSFAWWLVIFPAAIAICFAVELLATWGLGRAFWRRMPGWAQIVFVVTLVGLGVASGILLAQYDNDPSA